MIALSVAMNRDAREVLADEGRLLVKKIMQITPPKNEAQGDKAVRRDLARAMKPLNEDYFESAELKKLVRETPPEQFEAKLVSIKGWDRWRVKPFSKDLHKSRRNKRGRVSGTWRDFVYPHEELEKYTEAKVKNVGMMKAAWAESFINLGGKVSSWIKRHTPSAHGRGGVIAGTNNAPFVEFENASKGITTVESRVQYAVRIRAQQMARRVKLILSGYKKEMAAGMKAKAKARKTPSSMVAE